MDLKGILVDGNPASEKITGYRKEELIGKNLFQSGLLEKKDISRALKLLSKNVLGMATGPDEVNITRKDGRKGVLEISTHPVFINGKRVVLGIARDITDRKKAEKLIEDMAFKDSLTGLPNRRLFDDRFEVARSGADRNRRRLAVLVMDLDGFKEINDSYGHQVGDKVLIEVGKKLKQSIRKNDTVARLGGDEFIILLNDIRTRDDADRITKKILDFFRDYFVIGGHKIKVRLSMGTSIYPDDGQELEDLIKKSDTAMYWIKNHGKDGYRLFGATGRVHS